MEILRRSAAPVTSEAWEEMDEQAKQILTTTLSARKFADVEGPFGWKYAAHPLGRLDLAENQNSNGVRYGVHKVLPLVESRRTFELSIWELDNISRGAKNPDLSALEEAAREMALFEEKAVYFGLAAAGIEGLAKAAEGRTVPAATEDGKGIVNALTEACLRLNDDGIEGPYALVASPKLWKTVYGESCGYPLSKHVERIVEKVILSSQDASFVVSLRGGDFELVLGQDFSLGFEERCGDKVRLFLAESFTFQVNTPEAVVALG